jgi:hypothetical protein
VARPRHARYLRQADPDGVAELAQQRIADSRRSQPTRPGVRFDFVLPGRSSLDGGIEELPLLREASRSLQSPSIALIQTRQQPSHRLKLRELINVMVTMKLFGKPVYR